MTPPGDAPPPAAVTYVVQPGDSLASIAKKYYGDESKWRLILDANSGALSKAPGPVTGAKLLIPPAPAPVFPHRVWHLQDPDPAHNRELIELAPRYGVTEIQLSHDIVMDAEDVLNSPGRTRIVNDLARLAHDRGLAVTIWVHELNGVPESLREGGKKEGRVDLRTNAVWDWLAAKYNRLYDLCPQVDGVVLTFHETQASVYHDRRVVSDDAPAARVTRLIDTIGAVCVARKKRLVVRTFCYEPSEVSFIQAGLAPVKTPIVVMTKCQPHDWQPYYPHSPEIGVVGGRPQIIEFDLGYEFLGQSTIPYCDLPYLRDRMVYDRAHGACGAVLRIERHGFRAYGTPNWGTVVAFSQYLRDPSLDPEKLLDAWLAQEFGEAAVTDLEEAFLKSFGCVNRAYFPLGAWFTCHSKLSSYGYATESLKRRANDKWDPDAKWPAIREGLQSPTAQSVAKIMAEKADAARLAAEIVLAVERAAAKSTPEKAAYLREHFGRLPGMVEIWTAHQEAYFQCRRFEDRKEPEAAEAARAAAKRLRELGAKHRDLLLKLHAEGGPMDGQVKDLLGFAEEVEKRVGGGN